MPSKSSVTTNVKPPNVSRVVIFPLGAEHHEDNLHLGAGGPVDRLGLQFGLLIALGALGLSIIYGTTGLTNFAHGEIITFGALATWTLNAGMGMPLRPGGILGLIASGAFGWLNNAGLWRPLRKRGTGLIAMMIVSIGLAIFLRNFFLSSTAATSGLRRVRRPRRAASSARSRSPPPTSRRPSSP